MFDSKKESQGSSLPIILIVDDVTINLQILTNMLKNEKYKIMSATSGEKALSLIAETLPDLILLDVVMPGIDGFQVCEQLKKDQQTCDIPIIFLTSKTETEDILKGFSVGGIDYVTKPFEANELLARVHTHVDLKLSRDVIIRQRNDINELIHVLCHDLTNPLGAARGILEMQTSSSFERMKPILDLAIGNAIDTIDLIRNICALTENKTILKLDIYNLADLVKRSAIILKHRLDEKSISS